MKKTLIVIYIVIFLVNIPPIKSLFEVFLGKVHYYTTANHGFSDSDYSFKRRTFDEVWNNYEVYKRECKTPDMILYRTFKMEPQKVWLWGEYLFYRKYRLPYLQMPKGYDYRTLKRRCK